MPIIEPPSISGQTPVSLKISIVLSRQAFQSQSILGRFSRRRLRTHRDELHHLAKARVSGCTCASRMGSSADIAENRNVWSSERGSDRVRDSQC